MDFSPDEGQQAVADVVTSVLDRDNSWDALVAGGVTALAVPERLGGDGVGLPEIATALTEIGRHGTISPALATLGLGSAVLLDLASDAQQDRYLAGVAKGSVLTAALNEPGAPLPDRPATTFAGGQAQRHEGRRSLCGASGLDRRDGRQRGRGGVAEGRRRAGDQDPDVEPRRRVHGDVLRCRVPTDVLEGAQAHRVNQLALAAIGAFASGLVAGALRLTADYVANRDQFGKPLSTFQTVAAQLAEVYIASRTLTLAATSVMWRLSEGRDADDDLDVLGYWLASQAPPVMQICHHLHGGMGMDIAYPMDRYYSTIKDLTRLLGGPSHRLDLVGAQCSSN